MKSNKSIARIAVLLAGWAWVLAAILLLKAILEHASIFPLGQVNENLLAYLLVLLLGLAGVVFYIFSRVLANDASTNTTR